MTSFDEFLTEQEKAKLVAASRQKEEGLIARQRHKSATESWTEVQNVLTMLTWEKRIFGVPFIWSPKAIHPAMLTLEGLAVMFDEVRDGDMHTVTFGPIPGNEDLWSSPPPDSESATFKFLGEGKWGVFVTTHVMNSIDSEQAAQRIAEDFTKYFRRYLESRGR